MYVHVRIVDTKPCPTYMYMYSTGHMYYTVHIYMYGTGHAEYT